jgi:hypothetical protein
MHVFVIATYPSTGSILASGRRLKLKATITSSGFISGFAAQKRRTKASRLFMSIHLPLISFFIGHTCRNLIYFSFLGVSSYLGISTSSQSSKSS